MKRILLLSVVLLSLSALAQNYEITKQDILDIKSCFEKERSHDLQEEYIDIDGEIFNVMSERNFANENISVCDKDELQKLSDVISYESYGVNGQFGSIVDWKSMNKLFGSRIQAEQASMSYMQEGSFHLMCHGISDQSFNSTNKVLIDGKEVDAKRAARIILKQMDGYELITKYTKRPLVVVIHACGVGEKSNNSFASELSGYLSQKSPNIYVVAAPGQVYPTKDTWVNYKERVLNKNKVWVNWNCFHNGKFISEGEKDFDKTVTMIQKKYSK